MYLLKCFVMLYIYIAGPQAMISSSATYAGITYALDMFFGGGGKGKSIQDEFGFKDAPVEE